MVAHDETQSETQGEARDIYELLGIDSSASATLAQDVYWRRVNAYLDADRAGDPEARAAIAELNAALAIVIDRDRRAEYDQQRRQRFGDPASSLAASEARARQRSLVVVGLVPLVGIAMWLAIGINTAAAVVAGLAGIVVLLLAAHWANKEIVAGVSPFRLLHLREDATLEDLQGGYQSEVGRLLIRARFDRNAIRDLEHLDQAYLRATDLIARGESGAPSSLPEQWTGRLGGLLVRGVRGSGERLSAFSILVVRGLVPATNRLGRITGKTVHAGWTTAARHSPAGRSAERTREVERRLDSAFRDVTERIAVADPSAEAAQPTSEQRPRIRAALVLESSAGRRIVPVGGVPLRIGSDGACDLVLRQDGVMPEHAMAWVRDGAIVLHVIHQHASCLVNGEPTTWAMLEDGDEVRFGEAKVTVSIQG